MNEPSPTIVTEPGRPAARSRAIWRPGSPAGKVGLILALLLLMQIPLLLVSGLIHEREQRADEVLAIFRHGWGPEQAVAGPLLIVPYTWWQAGEKVRGFARLPASSLRVAAALQPRTRKRGLFHAVIYDATVEISGDITVPPFILKDVSVADVDWVDAHVVLGASDLRGMQAEAPLDWNGGRVSLQARNGSVCGLASLWASAGLANAPSPDASIPFKATLLLRGTEAFRLMPVARDIDLRITSPWRTPSFIGASLPLQYTADKAGFDAQWQLTGDPASAGWQVGPNCGATNNAVWTDPDAQVGVELHEAVPTYVMVDRAAKYGVFFLALTYLTLFLFETLSGVPIHLVQYGLIGLSVSLFALLLISIAEPLGFTPSYAISAAAVIAQASLYTRSVVRRRGLAATFAAVLATLFAFLFVVLSLDAYALLAGSVLLFAVLSGVMLATRRVNWSSTEVRA